MDRSSTTTMMLVVAALLALAPAAVATSHTAMPAPQLTAGDSWTFATQLFVPGSETIEATATASFAGAGTVDGTAALRIDTHHEGQREGEATSVWYAASDFAKLQVMSSSPNGATTYSLESPCAEWRFPMRVGDEWSTSCTFTAEGSEPFTIASEWRVVRAETITVPAGEFDTVVLEQTGEGFVERWWFAPQACYWVRHESLDAQGAVQSSETLTAFTCANPQEASSTGDGAGTPTDGTDTPADSGDSNATTPDDSTTDEGAATDEGSANEPTPTTGGTGAGAATPTPAGGETADTPAPGALVVLAAVAAAVGLSRSRRA